MACKKKNLNVIALFDILENNDQIKELIFIFQDDKINSQQEVSRGVSSLRDVNLVYTPTAFLKIFISSDFNQIMITDEQEKFILIKESNTFVKRNMRNLEEKNVLYAREDSEGGFYFIACGSYDTFLSLHHSQRKEVQIQFPRDVEPGIIRIFDINLEKEKMSPEELKQEYDDRSITVRMLSMKDDEFLLDKCKYDES